MPVGTFDFTGANGELPVPSALVIEVIPSLVEITMGVANRRFLRAILRFEMALEAAQHFGQLVVQQTPLLSTRPGASFFLSGDDLGRCPQIFTDMVEEGVPKVFAMGSPDGGYADTSGML